MRRNPFQSTLLITCLSLAATGCNAPGARTGDTPRLGYFAARGFDLMDVLEFNVGAGTGLCLTAAVEPIKVGYGYYQSSKVGLMGRAFGSWDERRKELFIGLHHLNWWQKRPSWGNGYLFTKATTHRTNRVRDPNDHSRLRFYEQWGWITRYEDHEKHWLDLSVEAHLLFVGVDVGLSVQEAVDFVLGVFGSDAVSRDDYEAAPDEVVEDEFRADPANDLPPRSLPPR